MVRMVIFEIIIEIEKYKYFIPLAVRGSSTFKVTEMKRLGLILILLLIPCLAFANDFDADGIDDVASIEQQRRPVLGTGLGLIQVTG